MIPQLPASGDLMPCRFAGCELPGVVPIVTWSGFVMERCEEHARHFVCWPTRRRGA